MSQLIHQGKFRERANRTSRYQQSENRQVQLDERHYAPMQKVPNSPVSKTNTSTTICNQSKNN